MKKKLLLLPALVAVCILFTDRAHAQVKVGDNPTTINAGSALEVEGTNKAFMMPRIGLTTTTTWGLLGIATAGMTCYNTNAAITSSNTAYPVNGIGEYYWDGTGWLSKKANSVNNGLLPFLSLSATTDGQSTVTFAIPVDILLPSTKLKVTFTFYTNNGAGSSPLTYEIPGSGPVVVTYTGPCTGSTAGRYHHGTVTMARPAAPGGIQLFHIMNNAVAGCQSQLLYQANIVVQPVD